MKITYLALIEKEFEEESIIKVFCKTFLEFQKIVFCKKKPGVFWCKGIHLFKASNAEASFFQSTRTQRFLKII